MSEPDKKDFEELSVAKGQSNRWKKVQLGILISGFSLLFLALFFGFKLGYLGVFLLLFVVATVFNSYIQPHRKRIRKKRL